MTQATDLFARFAVDERPSCIALQSMLGAYARERTGDPSLRTAICQLARDLRGAGAIAEHVVIILKATLERAGVHQQMGSDGVGLYEICVMWCIQEYYTRDF